MAYTSSSNIKYNVINTSNDQNDVFLYGYLTNSGKQQDEYAETNVISEKGAKAYTNEEYCKIGHTIDNTFYAIKPTGNPNTKPTKYNALVYSGTGYSSNNNAPIDALIEDHIQSPVMIILDPNGGNITAGYNNLKINKISALKNVSPFVSTGNYVGKQWDSGWPNKSSYLTTKLTSSELGLPTKTGYLFTGFYDEDNNIAIPIITNELKWGSAISSIYNDTEITLYAHWKPNTYNIRYNANTSYGGSAQDGTTVINMREILATYNTTGTLSKCKYIGKNINLTFTNNKQNQVKWNCTDSTGNVLIGYTNASSATISETTKFIGWSINNAVATTVDLQDLATFYNLTATNGEILTLYALWSANKNFTINRPYYNYSINIPTLLNTDTTIAINFTPINIQLYTLSEGSTISGNAIKTYLNVEDFITNTSREPYVRTGITGKGVTSSGTTGSDTIAVAPDKFKYNFLGYYVGSKRVIKCETTKKNGYYLLVWEPTAYRSVYPGTVTDGTTTLNNTFTASFEKIYNYNYLEFNTPIASTLRKTSSSYTINLLPIGEFSLSQLGTSYSLIIRLIIANGSASLLDIYYAVVDATNTMAANKSLQLYNLVDNSTATSNYLLRNFVRTSPNPLTYTYSLFASDNNVSAEVIGIYNGLVTPLQTTSKSLGQILIDNFDKVILALRLTVSNGGSTEIYANGFYGWRMVNNTATHYPDERCGIELSGTSIRYEILSHGALRSEKLYGYPVRGNAPYNFGFRYNGTYSSYVCVVTYCNGHFYLSGSTSTSTSGTFGLVSDSQHSERMQYSYSKNNNCVSLNLVNNYYSGVQNSYIVGAFLSSVPYNNLLLNFATATAETSYNDAKRIILFGDDYAY